MLQKTISELCRLLGLEDEGPVTLPFTLSFDNQLHVTLSEYMKKGIIEAEVLPLEKVEQEQLLSSLKKVLRTNLARLRDSSEILTIHPENNKIILFKEFSAKETDAQGLMHILEGFLNSLELLKRSVDTTRPVMDIPGPSGDLLLIRP